MELLLSTDDTREALRSTVSLLKTTLGFDAIGIRLQSEKDFPYLVESGFPREFLAKENSLVVREEDGGVCQDEHGNIRLECTCGLVLTGNARDAMPNGGSLTVKTELAVLDSSILDSHRHSVPPGKYALLTVSDTGTGIAKDDLDHIFEPFFTTKEVGKGTGLGMAIIYGIIKQHNGYINVYSEPGQGTTFRIYLPIMEAAGKPAATNTPEDIQPKGGHETILVAEDDPAVRKLVSTILTSSGYRIILAEDGDDALEKFRQDQDTISLLLLDMIMPKKNGSEAYAEIQRIKPGVKVLFSRGYTADFFEDRGVSDHGIELLMKPVQPTALLRKVREVLDR